VFWLKANAGRDWLQVWNPDIYNYFQPSKKRKLETGTTLSPLYQISTSKVGVSFSDKFQFSFQELVFSRISHSCLISGISNVIMTTIEILQPSNHKIYANFQNRNPHSPTFSICKRLDMEWATVLWFLSETTMAKYRQHLKITYISNRDYE
jgi:hypothetical protein